MGLLYVLKYKLWRLKQSVCKNIVVHAEHNYKYAKSIAKNGKSNNIVRVAYKKIIEDEYISEEELMCEVENEYEHKLRELMCLLINAYRERNLTDYGELCNEILIYLNVNSHYISIPFLMTTEKLLILVGKYDISYKIRSVSQKNLINKFSNLEKVPSMYFMDLFWALDECEEYDLQRKLVERLDVIFPIQNKETYRFLMNKLGFKDTKYTGEYKEIKSNRDFYNLVKDKKIAIVGPARSELNIDEVYKEFDFVIRINDQGENGSNKTINYFCSSKGRKFLEKDNHKEILCNFKYNVFKSLHILAEEKENYSNCREIIINLDKIQYNAEVNMVQNIITDLLYFEPKLIKIFCINFFLSKLAYSDEYLKIRKVGERNTIENGSTFAGHNYLSQFVFTKKLYDANLIELDEVATKYISLSVEKFVEKFNDLYKFK